MRNLQNDTPVAAVVEAATDVTASATGSVTAEILESAAAAAVATGDIDANMVDDDEDNENVVDAGNDNGTGGAGMI
jgi:hypothetical protein